MWNNLTSGIAQENMSMYYMCETISTVKHTEISLLDGAYKRTLAANRKE